MRFVLSILAVLVLLGGCANSPVERKTVMDDEGWVSIPLMWKESGDVNSDCRTFLKETGKRAGSVAGGCSDWRDGKFYIITRVITRVITEEHHFCTVGHEVGHGHPELGHFHAPGGKWVIKRITVTREADEGR